MPEQDGDVTKFSGEIVEMGVVSSPNALIMCFEVSLSKLSIVISLNHSGKYSKALIQGRKKIEIFRWNT